MTPTLALVAALLSSAAFDVREGTLAYTVLHKLHVVRGTTRSFERKVVVATDGTARVQVRAKVASFDSGNSNRDEHMREVTHEVEHPYCEVKGTAAGVKLPLNGPQKIPRRYGGAEWTASFRRNSRPAHAQRRPAARDDLLRHQRGCAEGRALLARFRQG
jgi:hypothetical protein